MFTKDVSGGNLKVSRTVKMGLLEHDICKPVWFGVLDPPVRCFDVYSISDVLFGIKFYDFRVFVGGGGIGS